MVTGMIAGAGPWPSRVREHGRAPPACRADHRELLGRAQILDLERALKELPSCEREPAADAGEAAIGQRRGAPGAVDPGGEGRDGGLHRAAVRAALSGGEESRRPSRTLVVVRPQLVVRGSTGSAPEA